MKTVALITLLAISHFAQAQAELYFGPSLKCDLVATGYIPNKISLSIFGSDLFDPLASEQIVLQYDFPEFPSPMKFLSPMTLESNGVHAGKITNLEYLVGAKLRSVSGTYVLEIDENGKKAVFQGPCTK